MIDNKKKIHDLPNELTNQLRVFKENLQNTYNYSLVLRPPFRTKVLLMIEKD